jgi:glycosyltransferase involved in cell wall biosynthesis
VKIVIINKHPADVIGGSEIQCDIVARHLQNLGHEVTYGVVNPLKEKYDSPYACRPLMSPYFLSYYRLIKGSRPDAVYWRFNKNRLALSVMIARLMRAKFVYAITSLEDTEKWILSEKKFDRARKGFPVTPREFRRKLASLKNAVTSFLNYSSLGLANGAISLKSDLLNKVPVKKQTVIYDSMTEDYVPFIWRKPYIVWVSSIKPRKNPEYAVRIAQSVYQAGVDVIMVGKIVDSKYAYLTKKNELPSNLHYIGSKTLEEVNGIIRSSLFLVHTCNPEGFPNNFIQAWLQGKPTVSLFYDPDNVMQTHSIGKLSGSFETFAEDVKSLIENRELREEIGRAHV